MEQQVALLRSVAQRLVDGPRRLLEQQEALLSAIKSPAFQGEDLDAAFRLLTETAARLMQVARVGIWRFTDTRDAIRCLDLYELAPDRHSAGVELQLAQFPLYFEALATSEAICADDARTDLRTREFSQSYLEPLGITAMMDIPLILYGRLEGVLCHEQVGVAAPWLPEDRLFGMALSNLVVLAIERTERNRAARRLQQDEQRRRFAIEDRLRQSEERYRTLVDNLRIVVFQTDAIGRWIYLNPAWTDLTGFSVAESLATSMFDYLRPEDRHAWLDLFASLIQRSQDCRTEARVVSRTGESRWVEGFARSIVNHDGKVVGSSGTLTDITERKAVDARIQRLAYHDALTGLPNRTLLLDRLDRALVEAKRYKKNVAILYLDLDDFKVINDTLGHAVGDRLLSEVAKRLTDLLREEDTVARFGGDEFLVLSGAQNPEDAASVAEKAIQGLNQPFTIDGKTLRVTASIGISIYPKDGADRETLLMHADSALYKAKNKGRSTYQYFESNLREL